MISFMNELLTYVNSTHLHGSVDLVASVDDGVVTNVGIIGHDVLGDCIVRLAAVVRSRVRRQVAVAISTGGETGTRGTLRCSRVSSGTRKDNAQEGEQDAQQHGKGLQFVVSVPHVSPQCAGMERKPTAMMDVLVSKGECQVSLLEQSFEYVDKE